MSVKLVCKQDRIRRAGSSATWESGFLFLRASVSSLVKWGQFRVHVAGPNTSSEANVGGSETVTNGGKGVGCHDEMAFIEWTNLLSHVALICFCC